MPTPSKSNPRTIGLDILRCCAILPVLIYHTPLSHAALEQFGFIGVEIFFSLSGFLVMQMIVERFDRMRTADAFVSFLLNRWMRTFPLYFLFVGIHIWISTSIGRLDPGGWRVPESFSVLPDVRPFLTFTQNLLDGGKAWNHGWFGVSWSLSVEEWFYLLVPGLFLVFRKCDFARSAVRILLFVIVASLAARTARFLSTGAGDFDDLFRRVALLRLDAFCYGGLVFFAMASMPGLMKSLAKPLAYIGSMGLLFAFAQGPEPGPLTLFGCVLYFALAPASVAVMIPFFVHMKIGTRWLAVVATFVSVRTYALYLCHMPVMLGFVLATGPFTLGSLPMLLVVHLLVADLLYRLIERPILAMRPHAVRSGGIGHPDTQAKPGAKSGLLRA